MKWCLPALVSLGLIVTPFIWFAIPQAQQPPGYHEISSDALATQDPYSKQRDRDWEGSAQGVAYSEFNHRFVGLFVLLFGLAELGHALRYRLPVWSRLVLPGALGVIATYLLIWSDHEAWPIGPLTFVQTFSGQNPEILQHKFYGVFSSIAAVSETLRRIGWTRHPFWAAPLVFLGLVGALLMFVHSHGTHPANHAIELHHALLGSFGVGAAISSAMVSWTSSTASRSAKKWEVAWAGFVIVIGLLLLVYSE
jgi:hypothetical protein